SSPRIFLTRQNIRVRGLSGRYLVSDGVAHLLRETCLEAVFSGNDNNKGITIVKIKQCQKKSLVASVSAAILSILGASNGFAQEGGAVPQAKTGIEEIVVTARRQSESLQTTPVAVTALTETMLQVKQIETIESVQYSTPNLNISTNSPNSSGFAFLAIRGQSNLGGGASNDPAIGVYVDGVYIARPGGSLLDLIDTRQVEVLRGPQGTLFGRNTTGGALNISSNEPVHNLEGSVQATMGNYGLKQVTGVINVP